MVSLLRSAFAVVVLASFACAPAAPVAPSQPLRQTVDDLTIQVALNPSPPGAASAITVEVILTDPAQQPVAQGRVAVALESQGHAMAPNFAEATPRGNGVYVATLKPPGMSGDHRLTIDLQWQDRFYRAVFAPIAIR
ncbi:MAG: FixH family protein [Chloroflexi bacterium]|nr:FixH family protein [Chloroflexota bacterium]